MLGGSLALAKARPVGAGDKSSGAPGDTDASPARSLTVSISHKLMNMQVEDTAVLELCPSVIGPSRAHTHTHTPAGLISLAVVKRERGWLVN